MPINCGRDQVDVLARIRTAFMRWRRTGRRDRNGYPETLKDLAVSGITAGFVTSRVATVAGVSPQSVVNWSRRPATSGTRRMPPVELELIATGEDCGDTGPGIMARAGSSGTCGAKRIRESGAEPMALIRFRSGASLELALSNLDAKLVAALNLGGVS